ncbi:class C sortase [Bifidobacterium sp. ESL0769]|uniref:class C sortase n=1 Tax=Bifidobacterium sp. ESL0769 TaxID=2983229 RepID=UPI0023F7CF8C|nr:class C sortase [Bifidobacterium sp. ESL0769]WEV67271.1 class C sortase [Bifidobacterium sp. ESL0769]
MLFLEFDAILRGKTVGSSTARRVVIRVVDVLLVCCAVSLVVAIAWFPTVWTIQTYRQSRLVENSASRVERWPRGKVVNEYNRAQAYNRRIAASGQNALGEFVDPFAMGDFGSKNPGNSASAYGSRGSSDSRRSSDSSGTPGSRDSSNVSGSLRSRDSSGSRASSGLSRLSGSDDSFNGVGSSDSISDKPKTLSDDDAEYQSLLNVGDGVMGNVRIPKISVNMPIYHGTSDGALLHGAGHLYGTSLPVGGKSTNAVLSGHRGLSSALLFTRLDELKRGDIFYVQTLGRTMGYRVTGIHVIDPQDTHLYRVVPGRDLVTLMTCTPYAINTQRLVITGTRQSIPHPIPNPNNAKGDPMLIAILIVLAVLIVGLVAVKLSRRSFVPARHRRVNSVLQKAKKRNGYPTDSQNILY